MFQVMHEAVGLHNEANEVGNGGNDDECFVALLNQKNIEYQHDDGEGHLDAFIEIEPSQFGDFAVKVFLHHGAVQCAQDHVEVGCGYHPVVPPFLLAEEAEEDADDKEVGKEEQGQVFCGHFFFHCSAQMMI